MRTTTKKILGAVAVAGLVAATGSAFTGTGISRGADAGASDFVGGTVSQTVTGATLAGVAYVTNTAGTDVESVTLTFAAALSTEQVVSAVVNAAVAEASEALTCATADQVTYSCTVTGGGDVDTLDISVSDANV